MPPAALTAALRCRENIVSHHLSSAVLLGIAALPATALHAQAAAPSATVQTLNDGLIAAMKAGRAAGQAGRAAIIGPVVDRTFDLPLMTRLVVGPAWNGFAPVDQQALVAAFRRQTIAQYAANFDAFSGQTIAIAPDVASRGADRLVRTTLSSKGTREPLNYRLRQSGGGWRIIDVFYRNAISQIATRRADYAAVLKSGGAKSLVRHLDSLSAKAGR